MEIRDAALWEAIQRGDATAFTALYNRYWRRLFTAAYARLPDHEACEEIVQDIFLTLWSERARLQIINLPAYLAAAVRYQAIRWHRAAAAQPVAYTSDSLATLSDALTYNQGESQLLGLGLEQRLGEALNQLPRRCREIFLLSRLQHYSNEEIAGQLHISRRSVENQLTAALRHLRLVFKYLTVLGLLFTKL